jgi:glycosyltransferase involved in cell wall biosynthesis
LSARTPVSIVVYCWNNGHRARRWHQVLSQLEAELSDRYALEYILVDDGSTDETPAILRELTEQFATCELVRQQRRLGPGAAFLTGAGRARFEVVCSLDLDRISADQVDRLVTLLRHGVDTVTVGPGHVSTGPRNVSSWRLSLCAAASWFTRFLPTDWLASADRSRIWRRSTLQRSGLTATRGLSWSQLLWELSRNGAVIEECPAAATA